MTPTNDQPPDWWSHSSLSWLELSDFLSDQKLCDESNWFRIPLGKSNHSYRLSNDTEKYFIQIIDRENRLLLPSLNFLTIPNFSTIFSNLRPWLVELIFVTTRVRIYNWENMQNVQPVDFDDNKFSASLLDFLFKLHRNNPEVQIQLNKPNFDVQKHIETYYRLANSHSPQHSEKIESLFQLAKNTARKFQPSKLCHNDLSLSNIMWQKESSRLKVLDWEYACIGDPIFDLASLIIGCQLSPSQENSFINQYDNKFKRVINRDKLTSMKHLSHSLSQLWELAFFKC